MRFLSPEWLESMRTATSGVSPAATLRIHQRVTGGPDGDVEYTLALAGGEVRFEPGPPAGPADVELTTDYATAAAISQGRLSPAAAFASGRLKLGGRVGVLAGHAGVLSGLGDAFGSLRATTEY